MPAVVDELLATEIDRTYATHATAALLHEDEVPQAPPSVSEEPAPTPPPEPAPPAQLSEADIAAVVAAQGSAVKECAAQQRAREPSMKGRLVMQWDILPSGTTANISAEDASLEDSELSTCMLRQIESWTFPVHGGAPQPVRFPFSY
jgi:hypothetical protein